MWTWLVAAALLAAFVGVTGSANVEPDWLYVLMVPIWLVGPLVLGYVARWRGVPLFAAVYVVVAVLHEWLFHVPDGWCEEPVCGYPTEGIFLLMPVLLVLVALGAATAAIRTSRRT